MHGLRWSWADATDADELAQFACTPPDAPEPWVAEAEAYVRGWALRHAEHVVSHRDEAGTLVAVSAFDETVVGIPLRSPLDHPGWHLQVVAINREHQNQRLSPDVFAGTFEAMRDLDPNRVFVTANVHRNHVVSQRACAGAGLLPWFLRDQDYWVLLGEVPIPPPP